MQAEKSVSDNMLLIRNTFQEATELASEILKDEKLIQRLEENNTPYKSIGYEATAMVRSLFDLEKEAKELPSFHQFLEKCPIHQTQIHIGLGWAFAKKKIDPALFLSSIDAFQLPRVFDGLGYCQATFNQRIVLKEKQISAPFYSAEQKGYDQGVGRALWYLAKGNTSLLLEHINSFSDERKADLWRGVGIAVTYVGGCEIEPLEILFKAASNCRVHLKIGSVLAASSRFQANSMTNDLEKICKNWCGLTVENALQISEETKAMIQSNNYFEWLELLQQKL